MIEIDYNDINNDGLTRFLLEDATNLTVGQSVYAHQPEDGTYTDAIVETLQYERGYGYLSVDWAAIRDYDFPVVV